MSNPAPKPKRGASPGNTNALKYGFGILWTLFRYDLHRSGIQKSRLFSPKSN